jgi:succinate-semialdehyde dehydrogenase/glutarate-semialdehyde dehydrogenase
MERLTDPRLLREFAFIDGKWQANGETIAVTNPSTGDLIGHVPDMGMEETRLAIAAGECAFDSWRRLLPQDRSRLLRRWYDLILANREDLAVLMTLEQGKPLAEATGEIVYGASFVEWFAEEGRRIYGDLIPGHQPDKRIMVMKQPIGVVAAITPWNFPNAMITRKWAPHSPPAAPSWLSPRAPRRSPRSR